jgi:hypothetical protein
MVVSIAGVVSVVITLRTDAPRVVLGRSGPLRNIDVQRDARDGVDIVHARPSLQGSCQVVFARTAGDARR